MLKSKTISKYDEVNPRTGKYKYNLLELDLYINKLESTITKLTILNNELVGVIRCDECKHYIDGYCMKFIEMSIKLSENEYCSYGIKKEV